MPVEINTNVLDWIMSHGDVTKLDEKWTNRINAWRQGEKKPTFNQIEALSNKIGIPFGYFLLDDSPVEELNLLEFRTIDSIERDYSSRELIDTMHDMEIVQNWVINEIRESGDKPLGFVGSMKVSDGLSKIAKDIRKILELDTDWFLKSRDSNDSFKLIRDKLNKIGVIVMMNGIVKNNTYRHLQLDEFRAFTMVDAYAPLIFINSNDSYSGRLFSLLHEFVHVCIGENSLYNDVNMSKNGIRKIETVCNNVAAEILVPMHLFRFKWQIMNKGNSIDQVIDILSKEFRCGVVIIARRALDDGCITSGDYHRIANEASKQYQQSRKKGSGGDYYRTAMSKIDNRVLSMINESVRLGRTSYTEAFRLTNTNHKTYNSLISRIEGGLY